MLLKQDKVTEDVLPCIPEHLLPNLNKVIADFESCLLRKVSPVRLLWATY